SLLVLAAHAVTVLLARYGRPTFEHWAAAAAGGAVLVVPVALLSIKQHVAIGWINPPGRLTCGSLSRITSVTRPWPPCSGSSAPWSGSCRRQAHGDGGPVPRRPAPNPNPHGGGVGGSRCPRWRRRCWCSRPGFCSSNRSSCDRCTSIVTSSTARRARPSPPAPAPSRVGQGRGPRAATTAASGRPGRPRARG